MVHAILKLTGAVGMKIQLVMILVGVVQWTKNQPQLWNGHGGVSLRSVVKPI